MPCITNIEVFIFCYLHPTLKNFSTYYLPPHLTATTSLMLVESEINALTYFALPSCKFDGVNISLWGFLYQFKTPLIVTLGGPQQIIIYIHSSLQRQHSQYSYLKLPCLTTKLPPHLVKYSLIRASSMSSGKPPTHKCRDSLSLLEPRR